MTEKQTAPEENPQEKRERAARKLRSLGIAYRILLVLGLVLFVPTFIVAVLTVKITIWYLAIPVAVFCLGLILARMEYNLFRRS